MSVDRAPPGASFFVIVVRLAGTRRARGRLAAAVPLIAAAVAALAATVLAGVAAAQTSAPPAEYRPQSPSPREAGRAAALLLPHGAPVRGIALPPPSPAEIAAAKARREGSAARAGERTKRSRLLVGFARVVPPADGAVSLIDLPWQPTGDGMQAARVAVSSPGAVALRLALVLTGAPPGLVVRFQGSAAGAPAFGPYAAAEIAAENPYWSPVLDGDTGTIEFALPAGVAPGAARLAVPLLSHLAAKGSGLKYNSYVDPYIGAAGACEVDIACLDATLQARARTATNAVARLVVTNGGETWFCTGTIVNDTATSFTPYLLTANHCLEDDDPGNPSAPADYEPTRAATGRGGAAAAASSINSYWQFQAATCGSLAMPNYVLVAGGAKLLARSADYDWALVRLNVAPPAGTTFAAWNAAAPLAAGAAATTIHHPEADLKKLSQGSIHGYRQFDDGSSFIEMRWTKGVTELGSSGAGLFTLSAAGGWYEVRGTLWAGESDCANPTGYDYYSRLDVAYPLLAPYLAPAASNTAKTTPVVEYYIASQDGYLITADAFEIAGSDNGVPAGRVRTGFRFLAYTDPATAPYDAKPVCRLYAPPPYGDTRFYSASAQECASMLAQPTLHFVSESTAAFYLQLPSAAGACPTGTRSVYRFLDKSGYPRRRYTTEVDLRDAIIATGAWTQEGYGTPPARVAMCAPAAGSALPVSATTNFQGLWWNPAEAGWGISFAHQGDVVFAAWFTYDASGKPWWLIAELHQDATKTGVYTGAVSTATGPAFNAQPWDPKQKVETVVGSATLAFADSDSGTFSYSINGVARALAITHQGFGPVPTCTWGAQPDLRQATNYTDLWWVANGAEAGWGINFAHQGDVVFATWFTYDAAGKPWWLIAEARKDPAHAGVYTGPVSTVTGPPFSSLPWNPNAKVETVVGSTTLTFANGNSATFAYSVNGVAQTKSIARQVFAAPGTVCN